MQASVLRTDGTVKTVEVPPVSSVSADLKASGNALAAEKGGPRRAALVTAKAVFNERDTTATVIGAGAVAPVIETSNQGGKRNQVEPVVTTGTDNKVVPGQVEQPGATQQPARTVVDAEAAKGNPVAQQAQALTSVQQMALEQYKATGDAKWQQAANDAGKQLQQIYASHAELRPAPAADPRNTGSIDNRVTGNVGTQPVVADPGKGSSDTGKGKAEVAGCLARTTPPPQLIRPQSRKIASIKFPPSLRRTAPAKSSRSWRLDRRAKPAREIQSRKFRPQQCGRQSGRIE